MHDHSARILFPTELWNTVQDAAKTLGHRSAAEYIRDSVEKALKQDGFIEQASSPATVQCPYCGRKIQVSVK